MQADKRNFEQSISILTEKLLLGTNAAGPNQTKPNPKNQRKQTKNNGVLSHEVSPQPQTHLIYPGLFSPGPNPPANFLKTHPHTNPTGITLNYVYIFFQTSSHSHPLGKCSKYKHHACKLFIKKGNATYSQASYHHICVLCELVKPFEMFFLDCKRTKVKYFEGGKSPSGPWIKFFSKVTKPHPGRRATWVCLTNETTSSIPSMRTKPLSRQPHPQMQSTIANTDKDKPNPNEPTQSQK